MDVKEGPTEIVRRGEQTEKISSLYVKERRRDNRVISKISVDGKEILDKEGIKASFLKFYSQLYGESKVDHKKLNDYIDNSEISKLTDEERKLMEEPKTKEEVEKAIDSTKTGKAPGPDGFTSKFYKTFKDDLTAWFQMVRNDTLEGDIMPQSWQNATIAMIPKQQEECPSVKNFRTISLLNVVYKLFTKIIAERFKKPVN